MKWTREHQDMLIGILFAIALHVGGFYLLIRMASSEISAPLAAEKNDPGKPDASAAPAAEEEIIAFYQTLLGAFPLGAEEVATKNPGLKEKASEVKAAIQLQQRALCFAAWNGLVQRTTAG